jgi:hypothetical protein
MAGGDIVGDVCKLVGRRCYIYDVNPVRKEALIMEHDLFTYYQML